MTLADRLTQPAAPPRQKGTVDLTPEGAQINNVVVEGEINGDWGRVFELFNLDATQFEVVDDTVRMSTWQQSARNRAGDRDAVQLYSYSARFRRVNRGDTIPPETIAAWRDNLRRSKFPSPVTRGGGTYVVLIADPQLGKKGTEEAVANWRRGVERHVEAANSLGVDAIHVAFMGDEIEAVADNYTNQPHTIELNQSQQLELDFDMRVWTLKQALRVGVPVSASSVISNHGEWTRRGSKDPVTTQNDNASTHIARQVQKLFVELEPHGVPPIHWTIGDTHPGITLTLSGVECYFTHGYVEKGRGATVEQRMKAAIERQILGRTAELGTVRLWFTAHYHHNYSQEFEGRTLFGCPALEAERSSEYMLDQFGVWSPPGLLGMVVTDQEQRGWRHKNIW